MRGRRQGKVTILLVIGLVTALATAACSDSGGGSSASSEPSGDTLHQPTQEELDAAGFGDLPLAPESSRRDVASPEFSNPTNITNPLYPINDLHSVVFSGTVEGLPFHTETTLLPDNRVITLPDGRQVEARVSQYFAYLDGRIQEVALDFFAQSDDGSVWYLGEDVFEYATNGFVESTEGTWLTGPDGPPAMIMPADPQVGDVYRAENVPPLAFEEVTVKEIDVLQDGPRGVVDGAMIGEELHLDGTTSDKVFAPGYGEFFSDHEGDVEPLAVAVPTDALDGPVPEDLIALSSAADELGSAIGAQDWSAASTHLGEATVAWEQLQSTASVPPLLAAEMDAALDATAASASGQDLAAAGTAAIDVAQSALDLQLQYRPVAETDLARFEEWTRQIVVDATAGELGNIRGDVTTLEWIRDRFADAIPSPDRIAIDVHLMELRDTVLEGDFEAATAEAEAMIEFLQDVQPVS